MDKNDVGIKLKRLRLQHDLSQEEVSYKLDISSTEYREYETGKRYPSDASLMLLLEIFELSEDEFMESDFVNHNTRKNIFTYVQIGLSFVLLLMYFLPFMVSYNAEPVIIISGYKIMFERGLFAYSIIGGVFLAFIFQFVLLLLVLKYKWSSIIKSASMFISFASMVLMWDQFQGYAIVGTDFSEVTLFFILLVLFVNIMVGLFDILIYPSEHDYLHDVYKVRRIFLLITNIVYFILLFFTIRLIFFDPGYVPQLIEYILIVLWIVYLLTYIVLRIKKKELLEQRLFTNIFLSLPPILFGVFVYGYILIDSGDLNPELNFIILFMFVPLLFVNTDYFSQLLRNIFKIDNR